MRFNPFQLRLHVHAPQHYMARTGCTVLFATTSPGVCLQYSQVRAGGET